MAHTFIEKLFIWFFIRIYTGVFFVLFSPINYIVDYYAIFKVWYAYHYTPVIKREKRHEDKVKDVQRQVLDWIKNGRENKMCTARQGWQTMCLRQPIYKKTLTGIKVDMQEIVKLDKDRRVVKVEPMVNMGQINAVLLPMGWSLAVVPELDDLTIGGLAMGAGIETSSHKFGLFQDICETFEIVLPNGEIVKCTKESDPELYHALPWSHGTIGFLTSVELTIVPTQKYVKLEYFPTHSLDETIEVYSRELLKTEGNQFIEGIVYSLDKAMVMIGNMTNSAEAGKVNNIGRWYKPWFYTHAETFLKKGKSVEYIPLRDYYERHRRATFWEAIYALPYGNNPIFRYLFGWCLPCKVSFIKLLTPEYIKDLFNKQHIIQDFGLPLSKLKDMLIFTDKECKVYPIWLCPSSSSRNPGFIRAKDIIKDEYYIDVGIYGNSPFPDFDVKKSTRNFEKYCIKNHGFQALYADTYVTKPEFRQMFNHELYDKMRKKYQAEEAFPDVYDKVKKAARI